MRKALILLSAVLFVSCGTTPQPPAPGQGGAAKPSDTAAATAPANTPPAPSRQYRLPEVQNVTQETVWRSSDNKSDEGDLPPWKKVSVDARLDVKPKVGDKVTIVPLDVDIAPTELAILKVTEENKACDPKKREPWWAIELEPITGGPFFETKAIAGRREEFPFDVCVIHPAAEFARQLRREQLTEEMVPEGVSINTVTAAVDLTNDGRPDLLIALYCCRDPTKTTDECDYNCGKVFKKTGAGWKLVDEHQPC